MTDHEPPTLPPDVADDWTETSVSTETVMRVRSISISVSTRVYDDESLRAAVRRAGGPDATLRFLFVSECVVPESSPSGALRKLVTNRAKAGFADRLADRGFENVRETGRRSLRVGDAEASAFGYEASCVLSDLSLGVEGWLVVWPTESSGFYLAGGAYPTSVLSSDGGAAADAVSARLDPETFRTDLFDAIRSLA
jgi:hypothetical protein